MNPKTLTSMILALLAANDIITDDQADKMLKQAGDAFTGQILDELTLQEMIELLRNPRDRVDPPIIQTPDRPKLII